MAELAAAAGSAADTVTGVGNAAAGAAVSATGEATATGAGAAAGAGLGAAAIGGGSALGFIWVCQTNHPRIPAPNTTAKASMASSHAGRPRTAALEALAMAGLES